jgi:hypothetical protein
VTLSGRRASCIDVGLPVNNNGAIFEFPRDSTLPA